MSKNSFNKLSSQDILSAHINGLSSAIEKIETILDMQTSTVEDYELYAISDIEEEQYNYRIYECNIRGWLTTPSPVIKVNGVVASPSTYEIQPAFGVIVFHEQQSRANTVTVSCTYIKAGSATITDISKKSSDALSLAQTNKGAIDTLESDMTQAKADIEKLKTNSGGNSGSSGGGSTETIDIAIDGYMAGGGSLNEDGTLDIPKGDVWRSHTTKDLSECVLSSGVAVATNTIDAFPFYVAERVIIDKVKIHTTKNVISTGKLMIGIYSSANGLPHRRLAQTPVIADNVIGDKESTFRDGNLRLEAGVYWIARWANNGTQYDGLKSADVIHLNVPSDMTTDVRNSLPCAGMRVNYSNDTSLPLEFPLTNGKAFSRTDYASPQFHITKSYI